MIWLTELLAHKAAPAVMAALVGVWVRFLLRPGMTLRQALVSVIAAISGAFWVAPSIAGYLDLSADVLPVIGYVCGIVAADVARGLLKMAERFAANPRNPWS